MLNHVTDTTEVPGVVSRAVEAVPWWVWAGLAWLLVMLLIELRNRHLDRRERPLRRLRQWD